MLLVLALGAAVLRALPLLRWGAWRVPVDYDEGVYSSATQLLLRGVLPYRDFVFVHPPGLLYFLSSTALLPELGPSQIFAVSRWVAVAVGGVNACLVGHLAWRWRGPVAGLMAAALYATYPEVAGVEHGPFLEPVLNLACLGAAALWLRQPSRAVAWGAGALLGYAVSVKVMGGAFALAALAATPREQWRRWGLHLVGAGVLAAALFVLPLALAAPGAFLEQVLAFHVRRPPDGLMDRWPRVQEMVISTHAVTGLFALLGCVVAARAFFQERVARLALTGFGLVAASFLATSTYWNQYNAFLAPWQALLAGAGAAALFAWVGRLGVKAQWVFGVALAAAVFPSLRFSVLAARTHEEALEKLRGAVARHVPPQACLFAFEPAWTLAVGRLPPYGPGLVSVVDSYAAMLLAASPPGQPRAVDATSAFASPLARAPVEPLLQRCDALVVGGRGRWQLGAQGLAELAAGFRQVGTEEETGLELWLRGK